MVSLKDVRISNAALSEYPAGLVAVFAGATGGIGFNAVKQLAIYAKSPKVYLAGRSEASIAPLIAQCRELSPEGTFNFIQGELSLVKEVDRVCDEIISKEKKVDLVFVATGLLSFAGRQETSEGIALIPALAYYCRLRFVHNLIPLLSKSSSPRVLTILGAGREGKMIDSDLELALSENYSMTNAMNHTATMSTLAFDELTKTHPDIAFVHEYPGLVNTGLMKKMFTDWTGFWSIFRIAITQLVLPVMSMFQLSAEEAGQRALYAATSQRFKGGGVYRLEWNGEPAKETEALKKYRAEGMPTVVWENTVGVWDRALSRV